MFNVKRKCSMLIFSSSYITIPFSNSDQQMIYKYSKCLKSEQARISEAHFFRICLKSKFWTLLCNV